MDAEIWCWKKRKPDGFTTLLASAVCEWLLMFLLFVDATLWYVVVIFARYCELEPPCMLCSRLDHGFGRKKPGFFWSLLCSDHREEISSLVSCSIHRKITNVRSLCEECLTPFTMQKSDTTCSCCSRALVKSERLLEIDPLGFGASRANIRPPLPVTLARTQEPPRLIHKDSLKRVRDKFRGQVADESIVGVDTMSGVAYTKLKLSSSDSDSEFAPSEDDDDGNTEEHSLDKPDTDAVEGKPLALDRRNPLSSGHDQTPESSVSLPHMPAISVLSEILSVCSVPTLPGVTTPKKQDAAKASENGEPSKASRTEATGGTQSDDTRHLSDKNYTHHIKAASIQGDKNLEKSDKNTFDPTKTRGSSNLAEVSTSDMGLLSKGTANRAANHKPDVARKDVVPVTASPKAKPHVSFDIDVIDIEGEDIIDQLKRQIESDQSCLREMYKDLEEERNASAVAAEEAMAMITRLQEEKAALRMEALHYLRMMEEQTAYDTQALERANDLLAEREKELQDLEYELEAYRNNYDNDDNDEQEEEDLDDEISVMDNRAETPTETNLGGSSNSER